MICSALPPLSTGDARYEFLGFFGPMSFPCTSRRSPQATAPVFAGILEAKSRTGKNEESDELES
ncbi:hypothetical protein SLEP1_g54983 [Rubroshorea leprosula]|uniref:Uncharacterized protein n=1 Tax=Rubroshorea leprosula TaxID=152421 RepID=A0AAV5MEX4_9ROSI|nr:hypothetical protein SLEP1_g54983 [Rubroshorea leprosula]